MLFGQEISELKDLFILCMFHIQNFEGIFLVPPCSEVLD